MISKQFIFESFISCAVMLRSSDTGRLVFYCILGVGAGIYLFIQGFRLLQKRHLILDTPVSKIRSASMGMVELSGLAVGPHTMVAPITERACYYYRTLIWEWKREGRSSKWVEVATDCMHVPFFLDDNTGKVLVDPRGAELDLHCDFEQQFCDSFFTTKEEVPPNVRSFLLRHGISTSNKIKVQEFCIKPKNALFVLGALEENPGLEVISQPIQDDDPGNWGASFSGARAKLGHAALSLVSRDGDSWGSSSLSGPSLMTGALQHDPAYDPIYEKARSAAATVVRLSPEAGPTKTADMTQQQKVAAALVKAGIASPAAWAAAGVTPSAVEVQDGSRRAARVSGANGGTQNSAQPAALDGFDPHPPIVLTKGKNNSTFLISWRSQRDLARSLGWKCTLMIWGGPALTLLCLYGLHLVTGWF